MKLTNFSCVVNEFLEILMKRARSCGNDRDSDDILDEISYNKRILSDRFCLLKITSGGVEDIGSTAHYTAAPEQNTSFLEGKGRQPSAINLHSDEPDEAIFPKCGRFKYARKVDYLIDEIIRKSRRTFCHSDEREITVPSSIGPQPTTDQAIVDP